MGLWAGPVNSEIAVVRRTARTRRR